MLKNQMDLARGERLDGLTLLEVMSSIAVLSVGVMAMSGVMLVTEQHAAASESRYQDCIELRNQMEELKLQISSTYPGGLPYYYQGNSDFYPGNSDTVDGEYAVQKTVQVGAAGRANLVRVEMSLNRGPGLSTVQIATYARAVD